MKRKDAKRCFACGGRMEPCVTSESFTFHGKEIEIKGISAYRCAECGEELYTSEEAKMIENIMHALSTVDVPKIDVLNLQETAQYLRVSNQTVYNMIRDGRIKAYKVGREWRFLQADIIAYMNASTNEEFLRIAAKGGQISRDDLDIIRIELEKDI